MEPTEGSPKLLRSDFGSFFEVIHRVAHVFTACVAIKVIAIYSANAVCSSTAKWMHCGA